MRMPRVRFTIGRMMAAVAASACLLWAASRPNDASVVLIYTLVVIAFGVEVVVLVLVPIFLVCQTITSRRSARVPWPSVEHEPTKPK
jgi:hypothetical protein